MPNQEKESRKRPSRTLPQPKPVTILVGDYGSGKTEVAVNLSLAWSQTMNRRGRFSLADLDLVNPYFRCREAVELLENAGIQVVVPAGEYQHADLPILLPEIKGLLQTESSTSLLDVGGDVAGSRVLAGLASFVTDDRTDFWFVVNQNRPFNDTAEGCLKTIDRIQCASGLQVTGLVANTHLMKHTTPEMVCSGLRMTETVAAALDIPVAFVALMESVAESLAAEPIPHPLLRMKRLMVPPWLRPGGQGVGPSMFRLGPT